jgi:membrane associated rhomboid family serine protease
MNDLYSKIKSEFGSSNYLMRLIYIIIGVFVLVLIIDFFLKLFAVDSFEFYRYFALHADSIKFITMPWTWISYSFFHSGFGHILLNMIMLYFSGQIFMQYLGQKQLIGVFFLSVISGGLFFVFAINVFPFFEYPPSYYRLVGASAGVLGVLIAIATYVPNYQVNLMLIGRVKIWYLAVFFIVLDLINFQSSGNEGGRIAHIGGALIGFIFAQKLKQGKDISVYLSNTIFMVLNLFKKREHPFKKVYKNDIPKSDYDYNLKMKQQEEIIDKILGKISKSGYESLTKEEKEILFNSGKK